MDSKWERYAATGGIAFVVLLLIGAFVAGSPPKPTDSPSEIVKFFADHEDEIRLSAFLSALATVPILWWAGSLWARLRRAEAGEPRLALVAVGGLFVTGSLAGVSWAISATTNLRLTDLEPSEVKFLYGLSQGLLASGAFGLAVLVGATSVLALRTRVFPMWLGWGGLALAVAWIVAGYGLVEDSDGFFVLGFVVFLVWLAWIVVASILMMLPTAALAARRGETRAVPSG